MSEIPSPKIFLIVEFSWPVKADPEVYKLAAQLHKEVEESNWIKEVVAGYGGVGGELPSIWIFKLENFALLDKLMDGENEDAVSQAYTAFFSKMPIVRDMIRQEVVFL